jgi:hypothetical protein
MLAESVNQGLHFCGFHEQVAGNCHLLLVLLNANKPKITEFKQVNKMYTAAKG